MNPITKLAKKKRNLGTITQVQTIKQEGDEPILKAVEELPIGTRKAWYRLMCLVTVMYDEMDELEDTKYFSTRVRKAASQLQNELEAYDKSKSRKVWLDQDEQANGTAADTTYYQAENLKYYLYSLYELTTQPLDVQVRFMNGLIALATQAGVLHPELIAKGGVEQVTVRT